MPIQNSFVNAARENTYDRNFGGTINGIADPYITGYQFINFCKFPKSVADYVREADGQRINIQSDTEMANILAASCVSVTPPGGTLNKAEFTGLGGIKFAAPTNVDYGNTLSMKFVEYTGLPILSIISGWVRTIRDYRTGTSRLIGDSTQGYTKSNYAGTVLYWTTKPDGVTVEFSCLYTGVFPTKDPMDLYSGDLASVDKLEVDIEFSIDWSWHESWVHKLAQDKATVYARTHHPSQGRYRNQGGDGDQARGVR